MDGMVLWAYRGARRPCLILGRRGGRSSCGFDSCGRGRDFGKGLTRSGVLEES